MENTTKNRTVPIALAGAALGAAAVAAGNALTDIVFDARNDYMERKVFLPVAPGMPPFPVPDDNERMKMESNISWLDAAVEEWLADAVAERVSRAVDAGTAHLVGYIVYSAKPTRRWAILAHGYRADHASMERNALQYAALGFNVLVPDLRAHGESDGQLIGLGWPDGDDVLYWVGYLIGRFGESIDVVLHGCSMGAATVLAASGRCTYPQVSAIIADSGYTSAWDVLADQIFCRFHVPVHPFLDLVNACFQMRGGYDLRSASMVEAVRASRIPTLIIQGTADAMVSPSAASQLYEAYGADVKEMRIVPGVGHAMALLDDPQAYADAIESFLDKVNARA